MRFHTPSTQFRLVLAWRHYDGSALLDLDQVNESYFRLILQKTRRLNASRRWFLIANWQPSNSIVVLHAKLAFQCADLVEYWGAGQRRLTIIPIQYCPNRRAHPCNLCCPEMVLSTANTRFFRFGGCLLKVSANNAEGTLPTREWRRLHLYSIPVSRSVGIAVFFFVDIGEWALTCRKQSFATSILMHIIARVIALM